MNPSDTAAIAIAERLLQAREWAAASEAARPLIERAEVAVRARAVIANAAMQSGDYSEAAAQFRKLRDALPGHAGIRAALSMALNNLGSSALQRGDAASAEALYGEALAAEERNALAWYNLGACAQARNDFGAAASAYARAAGLDPARVDARLQWTQCERLRGRTEAARAALAPLNPTALTPDIAARAGAEWDLLGEPQAAVRAYAHALAHGDASLVLRVAQAQVGSGDDAAGRANARRAAATASNDGTRLRAGLVAALGLPTVVANVAEIDEARQRFASGIQQLAAEWPAERLRGSNATLDDLAHSHFALAYYGMDDSGLGRAFGDWYGAAAAAIAQGADATAPTAPKPRSRHIALVSARWNLGTISAYFASWIGALRAAGWHVDVYHTGTMIDAVTQSIAASASRFLHLPGPLDRVVNHLRESAPAMLLYPEIGLSPNIYPLAALRLAPTQLAAWGHPVSSGLATIDAWLSCAEMEPVDGADHYREPLHLLPGLGTAYARPPAAATRPRVELGLPESGPLYLAPHSPVKLHPAFDDLITRIIAADPRAMVVMFEDNVPALTQRLRQRMAQAGVDPERHVRWLPRATSEHFRAVARACDVLLDSPGFSGGNTSLDAIAQGLPLVTLPGATMRSRQSAAMLRACGCAELIAESAEDYVERALRVANEDAYAAELRQRLLDPAAPLFDDPQPLTALVETLERLYALQ
ncbi:MAG: tetratricopeptide repeat protein [Xanthomonadales bacterium]|nr:tetratricopeptide repeat protein [Xanthomonadales bacterium]